MSVKMRRQVVQITKCAACPTHYIANMAAVVSKDAPPNSPRVTSLFADGRLVPLYRTVAGDSGAAMKRTAEERTSTYRTHSSIEALLLAIESIRAIAEKPTDPTGHYQDDDPNIALVGLGRIRAIAETMLAGTPAGGAS